MNTNESPRFDSPAILEWKAKERSWTIEAKAWVRTKLREYFNSESAYEPRTSSEIMSRLDSAPDMPTGYARVCLSDTQAYNTRYAWVRNTLEAMARARVCATGSTVNAKGREGSTTYARTRDFSRDWEVEVSGGPRSRAAADSLKEWLTTSGHQLADIEGILLTRKNLTMKPVGGSKNGNQRSSLPLEAEGSNPNHNLRKRRRSTHQ